MGVVTSAVTLEPLTAARLAEAVATLRDAFLADPLYRYFWPLPAARARFLEGLGRGLLAALGRHAEVWLALDAGEVAGVMGFVAPGTGLPPGSDLGIGASIARAVWKERGAVTFAWRGPRVWRAIARKKPRTPHHYLCVLATAPQARGRGIGKRLLGALTSRADTRGEPVYLETANPENLGFYRAHGFEVRDELAAKGARPPLWTMLRPGAPP